MRFVRPKTAEAQASATVFRTRDLLVRQRTQMINALRGHLAEFGMVVRKGAGHAPELVSLVRDPTFELPDEARAVLEVLAQMLQQAEEKIAVLDAEIARRARANPMIKRLMTIPGVGPIAATALAALAPAPETFRRGRDFAAWIGLTPLQKSSGGKERLGKVSKMGERTLRRLLIIGASSAAKAAARNGVDPETWLGRMLMRKPRLVVAVALANKIARVAWALMAHGGVYRASAMAA
jgi:transposase